MSSNPPAWLQRYLHTGPDNFIDLTISCFESRSIAKNIYSSVPDSSPGE